MASKATEPASTAASELKRRVAERFVVLPNFFRLASETPEITEKMWRFAQAAYLNNPLPSVFKERLSSISRAFAQSGIALPMQEYLTNTHRHSGSKTARIVVARKGENVCVQVQDHGKGMSRERFAEVQSHGTGVGLRGMRERAHQLHGNLSIESNSLGTKISVTFPAKTLSANEGSYG